MTNSQSRTLISTVLLISTAAMTAAANPKTAVRRTLVRPPAGVAMVVDGCTRSSWLAVSCTLASLGVAALADIGEAPLTSGEAGVYARARGYVEQLADHLVGRAAELDRLVEAFGRLERGQSAAVELLGPAGIGKTRLLAEFAQRVEADGALVLGGRGAEQERDLPFWVFVDALDDYVAGLDPRRLRGLDDEVRADLGQVLPSQSAVVTHARSTLQVERYDPPGCARAARATGGDEATRARARRFSWAD